ncbi:MAG: HupE/UreJ family protein [Rhodovulum sp.]|nr:HupE/UreJ family protein [Rhodovulum sp.]
METRKALWPALIGWATLMIATSAAAHNVTAGDAGYIQEIRGLHPGPFVYLGAKHMVTGYDHILFLLGVVFFLYRGKDIAVYVSLFAIGHSVTMLAGVLGGWGVNAYLVDAVIGLSVAYKALDNLGVLRGMLGFQPNTKAATLIFGLIHGTGLASKILDYDIAPYGLFGNLIAFNIGVEIGQICALFVILTLMGYWRRAPNFMSQAFVANIILFGLGMALMAVQIGGYLNA